MPIVHIHSLEKPILLMTDEHGRMGSNPALYIEFMHRLGAQAVIREAGFSDDITPACFADIPTLPLGRYQLDVDDSGERAKVSMLDFPSRLSDKAAIRLDGSQLPFTAGEGQWRIPKDSKALFLTASSHSYQPGQQAIHYIGGFLAQLQPSMANELVARFALPYRPWTT